MLFVSISFVSRFLLSILIRDVSLIMCSAFFVSTYFHYRLLLRHELPPIVSAVPPFSVFSRPLFFGPPLLLRDTPEFLFLYLLESFL